MGGASTPTGRSQATDFEELFQKYRQAVFNLLLRMTGNYDGAIDLTQDVFVRALRAWPTLRDPGQARTWLFRIARNVALRSLDNQRRHPTSSLEDLDETPASGAPALDDELLRKERAAALQRALNSLPAETRLILLLRDKEGMEYSEIAQVLGCSQGTVASRLNRARRRLGRKLEQMR